MPFENYWGNFPRFSLALLLLNFNICKDKAGEWGGFSWTALVYNMSRREHETHKTGIYFEVSLVSHWWRQLYDGFIYLLIVERGREEEDGYNDKKRTKKKKHEWNIRKVSRVLHEKVCMTYMWVTCPCITKT